MAIFRTAVLIFLVAGFISAQTDDTLNSVVRRVLDELREITEWQTERAYRYLARLEDMAMDKSTGERKIDRAIFIDVSTGKPITRPDITYGLKLTGPEIAVIAAAFKVNHFESMQANGLMAEGVPYTFVGIEHGVANAVQKDLNGALTMMETAIGVIVAHSPKGATGTAIDAVRAIHDEIAQDAATPKRSWTQQ